MQQHDGGIDPLEMIRVRPGIFIGGNDLSAIHYLLYQVIENSINQAESGQCSKLWVTLQPANAVMIKDDGPGIPVELYENSGRSILELIFTKELGRFDPQRSKFYPTMFGVGLPAVNALSEALRVEVARDGFLWQHNFEIGKAQGSLRQIRPLSSDEGTGTTITFTPDFTIFKRNEFSYSILAERLQDLAFLTPNLTITLRDERSDEPIESIFSYPEGLVAYVDYLRGEKLPVHPHIRAKGEAEIALPDERPRLIQIEVVAQYTAATTNYAVSFANRFRLLEDCPHMAGLRQAFVDFVNGYAREKGLLIEGDPKLTHQEVLMGLVTIVRISNLYPHQASEPRSSLPYPKLHETMYRFASDSLEAFAQEHPQQMQIVADWLIGRRFSA